MTETASAEWTLATVRAAAAPIARARGLEVRACMVGGIQTTAVRIELLRGLDVTCWLELPAAEIDAADATPGGVGELIERDVTQVLRMRHGQGAAA